MKKLLLNNLELLMSLHQKNGTITGAAKEFCHIYKKEYSDTWRRQVSKVINSRRVYDSKAKVLVFDIETAPAMSYIWSAWNQNPGHNLDMITNDWFVITWAAKWLFEDEVYTGKLTPKEAKTENDERIIRGIWEMLEQADVVIAHNALKFDIKRLNSRFLKYGINPPMPYQVIDTLGHARKKFSLLSNKLQYLANYLEIDGKLSHSGFDMWKRCMDGEQSALDEMERYNIQDIWVLEEVYLRMRSWIQPHPNIGLLIGSEVQSCPSCGSSELSWDGEYNTYVNTYEAFRCNHCGSIGRSRKSSTPQSIKSVLTVSTPK